MGSAIAASLSTLLIVLSLFPVLNRLARRFRLLDLPDARKQHVGSVPLTGGLAIYAGLLITALFVDDIPPELMWLLASGGLLVLLGAADDRFNLGVSIRLFGQALATLIMIYGSGIALTQPLPIEGWAPLPASLAAFLAVIAVVGLVNAFNMVDGIDGLAGSLAIVACLTLGIGQAVLGYFQATGYLLVFSAAVVGYLAVNLCIVSKRKVFLGDAGSLLIGFVIAWALLYTSQSSKPSLPQSYVIWAVAFPVFDIVSVMVRRIRKGLSPFYADRTHLHHICLRAGLSHQQALGVLVLFAMGLATIGLTLNVFTTPMISIAVFFVMMVLYVMGQLRIWKLLVWLRRAPQV